MSLHDPQCLCCIIQSLLIDDHSLVSFLEEWVESVKNGGVANVGILEDCPLTISDGFDKYGVDPLKSGDASLANPHKRLELIKDGSMSFQEGFHVFDLFGEVKRSLTQLSLKLHNRSSVVELLFIGLQVTHNLGQVLGRLLEAAKQLGCITPIREKDSSELCILDSSHQTEHFNRLGCVIRGQEDWQVDSETVV